ncbi:MAG: ABC transporter ATP-binding protein [Thaumarchaeota archaeon]|nr:ABC transporter ATP-binding protein [Nitrososphaerota archaeon]
MDILTTENLACGYGKMVIVNDVSIRVPEKQIVLLIGANGSGKSTLLKSIVGLSRVFGGYVYFKGDDITQVETSQRIRRGIGYVPQNNNTFSSLTVRTNLELGSYSRKNTGDVDEKIEEILQIFPDLKGRLNSRVGVLSGGVRQMVAMGRALMGNPSVFILDEPTAGIAPLVIKSLLSKVAELRDTGTTILLVEQNVKTAAVYADYVYLISQGRVMSEFTGSEISKLDIGELILKSATASQQSTG